MGDTGDAFKAYNEMKKEERDRKEPNRIENAVSLLNDAGYIISERTDDCDIVIHLQKGLIRFWAYTGWFCGKKPYGKIKGRGIYNLLKQLRGPSCHLIK